MKRFLSILLLCALLLAACSSGGSKKELKDGIYQVSLTMQGGSGRASIQSPARLTVESGRMTVTLIWSSSNYDYMIVDDVKYEPTSYDGGSTFEIPLKDLGELSVIADTVAMSTPHEVQYTLVFDAASVTDVQ